MVRMDARGRSSSFLLTAIKYFPLARRSASSTFLSRHHCDGLSPPATRLRKHIGRREYGRPQIEMTAVGGGSGEDDGTTGAAAGMVGGRWCGESARQNLLHVYLIMSKSPFTSAAICITALVLMLTKAALRGVAFVGRGIGMDIRRLNVNNGAVTPAMLPS